jgi:putative peptidoglycan lipid II flippase
VDLAYDGQSKTRWETLTYRGNPELGGLKRGVGLVLDLGTAQPVSSVELALSGDGTEVEVRVPKTDPEQVTSPPMTSDGRWRTVSKDEVDESGTLTLKSPVTTRFVLVYLRSLPREGSGYKGGIYEVEVNS